MAFDWDTAVLQTDGSYIDADGRACIDDAGFVEWDAKPSMTERSNGKSAGIEVIRKALFEDSQNTADADGPSRVEVPGTNGLLYRGHSHIFFGERGKGKTVAMQAVQTSAAVTGEKVLYLDRENSAPHTRNLIQACCEANEWDNPLHTGAYVGRHYSQLSLRWKPEDYAHVIVDSGFTIVTYDSWREFLTLLSLDPNLDTAISEFVHKFVTPLTTKGIAVAMLDNTGHNDPDRPKNSGGKLDATQLAWSVTTEIPFSPAETGQVRLTCKRSRYGDIGREWNMTVGGGYFELPAPSTDSAEAKVAKDDSIKQMAFREAAENALRRQTEPIARERLYSIIRKEEGVSFKSTTAHPWLKALDKDPTCPVASTDDGWLYAPGPDARDQPGPSGDQPPLPDPLTSLGPLVPSSIEGTKGTNGSEGPGPETEHAQGPSSPYDVNGEYA